MRSSSRIQASIEIIDTILIEAHLPADAIMTQYFRNRRYIGSQDRKAIAELTYLILRHKIILEAIVNALMGGKAKLIGRYLTLMGLMWCQQRNLSEIEELFDGNQYSPSPLNQEEKEILYKFATFKITSLKESEQLNIQHWQLLELQKSFGHNIKELLKELDKPAPLDLRVNSLKTTPEQVKKRLQQESIPFERGEFSPLALRLGGRRPLGKHPLWVDGSIEVQDQGSQLIAYLVDAKPGQTVWDYCAGAGGKTLAIAAIMENKGRLVASDVFEWRLKRSRERLKRAGVYNVECQVLDESNQKWVKRQYEKFDRVLIDVPCSGSGTWRRNPDLKWRTTNQDLEDLLKLQQSIMEKAAKLVKPGGRLIYSTCSLFVSENKSQIDSFLGRNSNFSLMPVPQVWKEVLSTPCPTNDAVLQLRPDLHQVDGFFVAIMEKA